MVRARNKSISTLSMSTLDFSRDMRYYIGTVYFVFLSLSLCFFLSTLRASLSSAFAFSFLPSFLLIFAFSSSFPSSLPPVSPSLLLFFFSSPLHFSLFSLFFNPPPFYYPSPFPCRFLFRPPSPVRLSFPPLFSLFSFPSIYSVLLFPYSWLLLSYP